MKTLKSLCSLLCLSMFALAMTLSGCTAQEVQQGLTAAGTIDAALQAKAQAQVDAMPTATAAEVAAKSQAQARVNSAKANADLYLLIGETVAPLLVAPAATQPAQSSAAN